MNGKILVTYASQGGSTAGIASAIGQTLTSNGAKVDIQLVNMVTDLSSYQAIVIGSAVHSGKWMSEAMIFVERNKNTLRQVPTAIFQVCLVLAANNEQYKKFVMDWFMPVRNQIQPVAEGSFAGALWPDQYPKLTDKIGLHIFLASVNLKAGDYRNWDAINTWSERIDLLLESKVFDG